MTGYLLLKLLHVLSASVLLGTGAGIAFFAWFGYRRALRTGGIDGLRTVLRLTVIADACFTAPAVLVQLASGLALVHLNGWSYASPWVLSALGLYALVGAFWLPVVVLQLRLRRSAGQVESVAELGEGFHMRFRLCLHHFPF